MSVEVDLKIPMIQMMRRIKILEMGKISMEIIGIREITLSLKMVQLESNKFKRVKEVDTPLEMVLMMRKTEENEV